MNRTQISLVRNGPRVVDIDEAFAVVSPKVREATIVAAEALRSKGIRALLVGGLGVSANGVPRGTKDVDFLVGEEAFDHQGFIVSFKAGLPIEVDGVAVDLIPVPTALPKLDAVLTRFGAPRKEGIAVAPAEIIILMKLLSNRRRDIDDIVRLLRAGVDPGAARQAVRDYGTVDLLPRLEERITEAEGEGE